ncbi:MAG: flagellin [Caldilineaceae bacterium]|nr:flagellin [Caldilineaceae bacterium]
MAVADFNRINSNIGALNALKSLNNVNKQMGVHQLRLATGRRINSASDDPAGLTIATTFRQRNDNLKVAMDNIGDGKNLLSVAEAGLNKVQDILIEMRNKTEQAASDTLGDSERNAISQQLTEYTAEINDIVNQTTWNGKKLLNGLGDFTNNEISLQTGAEAGETTKLTSSQMGAVDSTTLGIGATAVSATKGKIVITQSGGGATASATAGSYSSGFATSTVTGNELATGDYYVQVTLGSSSGGGSTAKLFSKSGTQVNFYSGGTSQASRTVNVSTAGTTVNMGNGITATLDLSDFTSASLGDVANLNFTYTRTGAYNGQVDTAANAQSAMSTLDTAIDDVSTRLQSLGALGSRLTFKEEALAESQVNTEAAYNRIMNADMAMDQLQATKFQILQQTATAMLGQANQAPQGILSLFR